MARLILPPQYFGSVYYHALLAWCDCVVDLGLRYDKRYKSVHRCTVADTRGPLTITVPVSRPQTPSAPLWSAMTVSSHGQWWSDHLVSLESAYGRTPYFEFFIDRFKPWLADTGMPVTDMDASLTRTMHRALGLPGDVVFIDTSATGGRPDEGCLPDDGCLIDMRRHDFSAPPDFTAMFPDALPPGVPTAVMDVPYWQIRADRLGFLPGLSVADLLFNMGPEAQVTLRQMIGWR